MNKQTKLLKFSINVSAHIFRSDGIFFYEKHANTDSKILGKLYFLATKSCERIRGGCGLKTNKTYRDKTINHFQIH